MLLNFSYFRYLFSDETPQVYVTMLICFRYYYFLLSKIHIAVINL